MWCCRRIAAVKHSYYHIGIAKLRADDLWDNVQLFKSGARDPLKLNTFSRPVSCQVKGGWPDPFQQQFQGIRQEFRLRMNRYRGAVQPELNRCQFSLYIR
jgi:hypothetical protein